MDRWAGTSESNVSALRLQPTQVLTSGVIGNDDRTQITNTIVFPYNAIVHIRQQTQLFDSVCTEWMFGVRILTTAAHCIHDSGKFLNGTYTFTPAYNTSATTSKPYGSCTPSLAAVLAEYIAPSTPDSQRSNYDFGIVVLDCEIGNATGYFGYRQLPLINLLPLTLRLMGYPGDKGGTTM